MGIPLLGSQRADTGARHLAPSPDVAYRTTLAALVVVPPLCRLVHLIVTEPQERWALFADDAFYYFGVARNVGEGNGSTFTELVATNGYHPLWAILLVPVVAVSGGGSLLFVVALLQTVLWAVSVGEMLRIGRVVGSWPAAAAAVAAYGVLGVITGSLAFNGMESALVVPFLLATIRVFLSADDRPRTDLLIGCLLALVCLARLDAVVAAVPLGMLALVRDPLPASRAGRFVRLAGPSAVALGTYLVVNAAVFGSATPVSGRAKALGAPYANVAPLRQFLEAGELLGRPLWFGAAATVLGLAAFRWSRAERENAVRRLRACLGALMIAQAGLIAYLVVGTSYQVWPWYHYLVSVYAFCATVLVGRRLNERYGQPAEQACRAIAVGFLVVQAIVLFRPEPVAYGPSVSAARFVRDELPADVVLAMGDRAGIFGYLADRPLLHLEGLVADARYLDQLESGAVVERMAADGVDYYVHYGDDGRPTGDPACAQFDEPFQGKGPKQVITVCDQDLVFSAGPEDDMLRIWRFRPELNGL